jgi:hypothetical protein
LQPGRSNRQLDSHGSILIFDARTGTFWTFWSPPGGTQSTGGSCCPPNPPATRTSAHSRAPQAVDGHRTAVEHHAALGCQPTHPARRMSCDRIRDPSASVNRRASPLTPRTETYAPGRLRAPRVPLPRVTRGQQRSLTSPKRLYVQISISAGQHLDRCPTFQAGAQV